MKKIRLNERVGPHVDVVKNQWLGGVQEVVARVFEEAGQLHIDTEEPQIWDPLVLQPLRDSKTGDVIYPEKEPAEFLRHLHDYLRGDYFFATNLHDESECPFGERRTIPIDP